MGRKDLLVLEFLSETGSARQPRLAWNLPSSCLCLQLWHGRGEHSQFNRARLVSSCCCQQLQPDLLCPQILGGQMLLSASTQHDSVLLIIDVHATKSPWFHAQLAGFLLPHPMSISTDESPASSLLHYLVVLGLLRRWPQLHSFHCAV